MTPPPLVLSIQSEVVFGHVGNSAARPVLSALGIETLGLPSVLLAHHPGHGPASGRATPAGELVAILDRLERLGVLGRVSAVLSGYLVDPAQIGVVIQAVERIKHLNPSAQFWCDPVLGDHPKGLYVAEAVAESLQQHLLPLADVLTPNVFEAAWLSGIDIQDPASAGEAAARLPAQSVIVTSVRDKNRIGALWRHHGRCHFATSDQRPGVPGGLGDTFAALLLGLSLHGMAPALALDRAIETMAALLDYGAAPDLPRELPLIAAAALIRKAARA